VAVWSWERTLAATYRREKGNFIPGMQRSAPCSKLLVPRGDQRCPEARKLGMTSAIVREKRFDGRAVRKLDRVFRMADNFLEAPEEKNLYARCL
jgi:hypothetical protein